MARCQHRGQSAEETNGMSAEREREQRLQTGDEDYGCEFDVEGEEMREVEGICKREEKDADRKRCTRVSFELREDYPAADEQKSRVES